MAVIGEIAVNVVAKTRQFIRDMRTAKTATRQFGTTARKSLTTARTALLALTGLGIGTGGLAGFIFQLRKTVDELDDLQATAVKLGLTAQQLGGLQFAANKTSVSTQQLNTGLQRMVRRVAEAAQGTGEAVGALKELRLNAERLTRLDAASMFGQIADAMNRVETAGDRVRLTMKLADTEGVGLVNTFALGSEGIRRLMDQANRGTEDQIKAAAELKQAWLDIEETWRSAGNTFALATSKIVRHIKRMESDVLPSERRSIADFILRRNVAPNPALIDAGLFPSLHPSQQRRRPTSPGFNQDVFNRGREAANEFRREVVKLGEGLVGATKSMKDMFGSIVSFQRSFVGRQRNRLINFFRGDSTVVGDFLNKFATAQAKANAASNRIILRQLVRDFTGQTAAGRATARRSLQSIEFDQRLNAIRRAQERQFPRAANRLIEATSLEGIARIRQSRRPTEKLEALTKQHIEETRKLGVILNRQDELQSLLK